jgi:hypothetical protein
VKKIWLPLFGLLAIVAAWFVYARLNKSNVLWQPAFLKGAERRADSPQEPGSPFHRTGSHGEQIEITAGLRHEDYLLPGEFDQIERQAKLELKGSDGWQPLYALDPAVVTQGRSSFSVKEMDAMFVRGGQAVTVYRYPEGKMIRVRVWRLEPTIFGL